MNGILLLAEGFETVEALCTLDVLKRSHKFNLKTVSITDNPEVISSANVTVKADAVLKEIHIEDFDFVILPGGKKGVDNLKNSQEVLQIIRYFLDNGKDVHAICAAPSILGGLGYLDGLRYTCFPGFQAGNGEYVDTGVVETPHIITGHSMGYSLDFGKAIIRHYYGEDAVTAILPGVLGLA